MDNQPLSKSDILQHFGGVDANSLENIFQFFDREREIDLLQHSYYYSANNLPKSIGENPANFFALCLNVQSVNAKFNNLFPVIDNLASQGLYFGAICLQET